MPITTAWGDDAQSHVVITFRDPWGWADIESAGEALQPMMDDVPHPPLPVVVDATRLTIIDREAFTRMPVIAEHPALFAHRNFAYVVVAGSNRVIDLTYRVFSSLYPTQAEQVHFTDTMEAARAMLRTRSGQRRDTNA